MTRAIRFALIAITGLVTFASSVSAQNYQPAPAQPQRASVYGPAVGTPGNSQNQPVRTAQAQQLQPGQGQIRPVADQQPIRQPGAAGANNVGTNGAGGQGGVNNPNLQVGPVGPLQGPAPKIQIVPPGVGPQQPEWYPLDPKVQAWVDQVLAYWEKRSDQVKTLEVNFQKWEYDPQYIPNVVQQLQVQGTLHTLPFTKYASGVIKYAAPDKGLFRVEQLSLINVADPAKPKYDPQPKENGEHWITDGKRVFAFDAIRKEVNEAQLPPDMQGKALADGPLPFMFGARAETIKARYWIRPLQAEAKGEYCLEAVPKSRQDAANFKSVQVVLDETLYLPTKMQIFEADFTPANPHRTAYKFDKHDVNATKIAAIADPLKLWHRDFFEVKVPSAWRHIVRNAEGNIVSPGGTAKAPPAGPQLISPPRKQ